MSSADDWEALDDDEPTVVAPQPVVEPVKNETDVLSTSFLAGVSKERLELRNIEFSLETLNQSLPTKKLWAEEKVKEKAKTRLERRIANLKRKCSKHEREAILTKTEEITIYTKKQTDEEIGSAFSSIERKHNEEMGILNSKKQICITKLSEYKLKCVGKELPVRQAVEEIIDEYDDFMKSINFRVEHHKDHLAPVTNEFIESLFSTELNFTALNKIYALPPVPDYASKYKYWPIISELSGWTGSFDVNKVFYESLLWRSGKSTPDDEIEPSWASYATWMEKYAASLNMQATVEADVDFSQSLHVKLSVLREQHGIEKKTKAAEATQKSKAPKNAKAKKATIVAPKKLVNYEKDLAGQSVLGFQRKMANSKKIVFNALSDKNLDIPERSKIALNSLFIILSELNTNFSMDKAVNLFRLVHDIHSNFRNLEPLQLGYLSLSLESLGFGNYFGIGGTRSPVAIERNGWKLLISLGKQLETSQTIVKTTPNVITFQLEFCGPFMLKELHPRYLRHPDITFSPDEWQYDLIKLIDADQSVLVVVPTSAGKTFSSFYVISRMMEKIKTEKPLPKNPNCPLTARVVFVAPTLPLANQMAADIYHRYGKDRKCGIYTNEFRQNVKDCEVMICTPDAFQTLLLSPFNEQWARDLLYVIFDEIHCIASHQNLDNQISPLTYTQVLSLVQCPFLALSATIRNPENFQNWLKKLHSKREIHLIPNGPNKVHRWTDLKKFVFLPEATPWVPGVKSKLPAESNLRSLHPFAMFNDSPIENIEDIDLSPDECLQLYIAIQTVLGPLPDTPPFAHLDPQKFFTFEQPRPICRNDCFSYQQQLKDYMKLIPVKSRQIISTFLIGTLPTGEFVRSTTDEKTQDHCLELFFSLKQNKMLPAICFVFNQDFCDQTVAHIVKVLEAAEPEAKSKNTKEGKEGGKGPKDNSDESEKTDKRSLWQELRDFERAQVDSLVNSVREYKDSVHEDYTLTEEDPFDSDMEWWLKRLFKKTSWKSSHPLIRGLMRGVAAYHAHLPKPYRDLVETLFRATKLKVVISTTVLSLGVNMPCKSVVFLKDDDFLTPVGYKQMAGRAGRRGFDHIGYTVFFNVPSPKIEQLLFVPLPQLESAVPLDLDTVLKILISYHEASDKKQVSELLSRLTKLPFNKESDQKFKSNFQVFIRCCIEFLYRIKLVDEKGAPIGLAGVVSSVSMVSPSNYALAYIIANQNVFESICKPYDLRTAAGPQQRTEAKQILLHILSYIIYTIPVDPTQGPCNVMTPIPASAKNEFTQYNQEVESLYKNSVKVFQGIGFEPQLEVPRLELLNENLLNSYVTDFYRHKKIRSLLVENQLSDYIAYQTLKKWNQFLKSFSKSLTKLMIHPEANTLCQAVSELSKEFEYDFNHVDAATI